MWGELNLKDEDSVQWVAEEGGMAQRRAYLKARGVKGLCSETFYLGCKCLW